RAGPRPARAAGPTGARGTARAAAVRPAATRGAAQAVGRGPPQQLQGDLPLGPVADVRGNTGRIQAATVAAPLLGQVQLGIEGEDLLRGRVLEGDGDLAVTHLAQGAAVLAGDADGGLPPLWGASCVQHPRAAGADGSEHAARQAVADGAVLPGALVDELLQGLLVVAGPAVDNAEALGQRLDALAVAVEEQAAEVDLGPAATGEVAEAV